MHKGGNLGPVGGGLGIQTGRLVAGVDATDQSGIYGPSHGISCKARDGILICVSVQGGGRRCIFKIIGVIAVQNGRNLLSGDGFVGAELLRGNPLDDSIPCSPGHGIRKKRILGHVRKVGSTVYRRRAIQAVQHRHHLSPGERGIGGKFGSGYATHDPGLVDIDHIVIVPSARRNVNKWEVSRFGAVGACHFLSGVCKTGFLQAGREIWCLRQPIVPGRGDNRILFCGGNRKTGCLGRYTGKQGSGNCEQKKNRQNAFHGSSPLWGIKRIHARIVTNCNCFVNTFRKDFRGKPGFFRNSRGTSQDFAGNPLSDVLKNLFLFHVIENFVAALVV